jgi:hypothetical protein
LDPLEKFITAENYGNEEDSCNEAKNSYFTVGKPLFLWQFGNKS